MRRTATTVCALAALCDPDAPLRNATLPTANPVAQSLAAQTRELPLRFEANLGQWNQRVRFVARGRGGSMFITNDGIVVSRAGSSVSLKVVGCDATAPRGEELLPTQSHFFVGNDPSKWRTNVPNYRQIRARCARGVDIVWHGGASGLEYNLEIAAGVDATRVELDFDGARSVRITEDGSLALVTEAGSVLQRRPTVTQDGRELDARYVVQADGATAHVRFGLDDYDRTKPVVIDPVLAYSSFLGGSNMDYGQAIAIDTSGAAYLAGGTQSTDFPTQNANQSSAGGGWDAFASKVDPSGAFLVFSTYLDGSSDDDAESIAVDASGALYIVGSTSSKNFPTKSPFQSTMKNSDVTAFVAKLDPTGALAYSTYLGGSVEDEGAGIAVDAAGNAYVTGHTWSVDFPMQNALQSLQKATGGPTAFVTELDPSGASLVYSTYLGGSTRDFGWGIAVDSSGSAYVTGFTESIDFPTYNAFQSTYKGGFSDAFVTKFSPSGASLVYSTYLGGSDDDSESAYGVLGGQPIAIDPSGNAYVTGYTKSSDFPMKNAVQPTFASGYTDAFVTKLDPTGSSLIYSTYLGGTNQDSGWGIAVDQNDNAYVAGTTSSTDYPTVAAWRPSYAGGMSDAFVTKLSATGSLQYSTFLGGSGSDDGEGIAVDKNGAAYVVGMTQSADFPVEGAMQALAGDYDVFVTKFDDPQLALGSACAQAGACASGFCVDGVCCNSACGGQCEACDVSPTIGTCAPAIGVPHGTRPACSGDSSTCAQCDGVVSATCAYATNQTLCASLCTAGVETDSFCDGHGNCALGSSHSCGTFLCAIDGGTCNDTCAGNNDCANDLKCIDGGCVATPKCAGDTCVDVDDVLVGGCACSTSDLRRPPPITALMALALAWFIRRFATRRGRASVVRVRR